MLQDHILRDNVISGMDSNFDNVLDALRDTISDFNVSSLTSKNIVPPKAQHVLSSALFSKSVQNMKVRFDMTIRQKSVFACLQAAHVQDFLLVIPVDGLGQHMSPVECYILRYRFMTPLFSIDVVYLVCRKASGYFWGACSSL